MPDSGMPLRVNMLVAGDANRGTKALLNNKIPKN